jgi:hypothetical protein
VESTPPMPFRVKECRRGVLLDSYTNYNRQIQIKKVLSKLKQKEAHKAPSVSFWVGHDAMKT